MSVRSDPITVLHVDDEPGFAETAGEFLERAEGRIEVVTAGSVEEGLERLEGIDCVVSDYDMPGMDGIAFLEAVREEYPDLPFILFTGKGSEEVASDAISAGATDYLRKGAGTDQYTVLANEVVNAVDRARTEKERRRQLAAIESVQEGIAILDDDGRFVYVNERYADLYGYDPGEMVGEHWELIYPDDQAGVAREEILPAVEERGVWHGETTGLRADGSTFPEDHTVAATGSGLVCTVRDLTEERRRERDLERYETVVEALGDPVYVLDEEGVFEYVNGAFEDLVGYDRGEVVGATPSLIKDGAAVERAERALGRLLSSDGPDTTTVELTIRPRDGDPITCEDHMGVLPFDGGEFRGSVGVLRDVSGRRERERVLRALHGIATEMTAYDSVEAVCERTIEAAEEVLEFDLCVINIEEDGVLPITALSEEVPPEGATAMSVEEGLAGETYRTGESFLVDDVQSREDAKPQADYRAALSIPIGDHGVFQAVTAEAGAFDEEDLELAELLLAHTERMLDRLEQERAMARQNERLEEFASIVSHDLRNPLRVAEGRVELVREECDSEHLERIAAAHGRMRALIEDLLALAREGESVRDIAPVDLAELVEGCWGVVDTVDATLVVETDATIRADRSRLRQLLENLFRNAVEHGSTSNRTSSDNAVEHAGADVTVTVGDLADGFYVADDGPGIPEEERDRVFEAGYSTAEDGTGFGLNIVETVVEAHGWEIRVTDSEAGGARFEITGVEVE